MRLLPLSFALLTTLASGAATAKPVRPGGALLPATPPPALEVLRGDQLTSAHVQSKAGAVVACAAPSRTTFLRIRTSLRWDVRGRIQKVNVHGGSAAFNRCAARALAGTIGAARRGSAWVTFVVRKPDVVILPTPPKPVPPAPAPKPRTSALQTCKVDSDCTIHFQESACISGDPVAVSTSADRAAVNKAFPVRHIACGMGGPQYDDLRQSNENRYAATCVQSRCTVHDAGPQPTLRSRLTAP